MRWSANSAEGSAGASTRRWPVSGGMAGQRIRQGHAPRRISAADFKRLVVLGGSAAGVSAAVAARTAGFDGDVTIVEAEDELFYDRCALSTEFLTARLTQAQVALGEETEALDIHWRRGCRAAAVDVRQGHVSLAGGEVVRFDRLVVATGVRARHEAMGHTAPRILTLRGLTDARLLLSALESLDDGHELTIVGGGLVGSELASSAAQMGFAPTLVIGASTPLEGLVGSRLGRRLLDRHRSSGVRVITKARLAHTSVNGHQVQLLLSTGATLTSDLVLLATGSIPNTEFLDGSGLTLDDGVVCDESMYVEGSEVVVAAGDVARVPCSLLGGRTKRVEHWASAAEQGQLAGSNLLRTRAGAHCFTQVPDFGTSIHGDNMRVLGFPEEGDTVDRLWGSPEGERCGLGYLRGGRLVGVVAINDANAARQLHPLLGSRLCGGRSTGATEPPGQR